MIGSLFSIPSITKDKITDDGKRKKGRDLTQSYDKSPNTKRSVKRA